MTEKQLQKRLRFWKKKLGLREWDIQVRLVKPWRLDDDCTARASFDQFHQKARLEITEPEHIDQEAPHFESAEHHLVHELLHCLLPDAAPEGSGPHTLFEQGLNKLARLLLENIG